MYWLMKTITSIYVHINNNKYYVDTNYIIIFYLLLTGRYQ